MARTQKTELKSIEPYDVSFAEVQSDKDWKQTVQKIATAINVQFTESAHQDLPFVPFRDFQSLLREDKVFLVGPSGCGKSRTIIELVRNREATGSSNNYDRIFIINPSNPAGLDARRENISLLSHQFGPNDLVIWDNFPEGLVKRDLQNAFGALEIINSRLIKNLYIALKPTYLEMYRGLTLDIPDIYTHEITCDLETMKALLKAYGKDVKEYREVFEKHVSANTDRIARILWQKQPLFLTIVDFYKALLARTVSADKPAAGDDLMIRKTAADSSEALLMAQAWLPVYDYFERQFEVMKNIPGRQNDVDFLYIMRFCYEVGFDRTHDSIAALQKGIFGSSAPSEPTRKLGTWVYLSGQNYAMHDSARNAVRLPDYSRMKIVSHLMSHFLEILPRGDGELYSLGLFLGRNIQFISPPGSAAAKRIVPEQVYGFMKKKAVFERAIGRGVGENFELLDEPLQESILEFVDTEIEFGVGLADSLGERFIELDDSNRERVLDKIYHGMLFARYFGQSAGRLYGRLSGDLRTIVMSHAEKNPQFADGLGMGLGYIYATLEPELQQEITRKAQKSFEISRGLGFGFGLAFGLLQEQDAKKMTGLADKSSELDTGFGMGLAAGYANLSKDLRRFVIDRVEKDCLFAFGAGIYAAFVYRESVPGDLFSLLGKNGEVAYGLGLGFGTSFFYLSTEFQSKLQALLKNDAKLDDGMGTGIGLVLKHLPPEAQEMFIHKASASNAFATGLGYGLGFTWHYIGDALRERALAFVGSNNDFARGLGIGIGSHIDYLKPTFFDQVILLADTNSEFDRGFGSGAALAWPYYSDDAKRITRERMAARGEFARGIGCGLARIASHFSPAEREQLMRDRLADPLFLEGFGEGTGYYLWSVYDKTAKQRFIDFAAGHPEVSKGLGVGLGSMYFYFGGELEDEPLGRFFEKDPDFRRGLGIGMGRAFTYLTEEGRAAGFQMADKDMDFAAGLGEGIGAAYRYLEESQRRLAMSHAEEGDAGFSRGLGTGLGSVFSYLEDAMKNDILVRAAHNGQLSTGLGVGLGLRISYLSEAIRTAIFGLAKNNPRLAAGLGEGCGLEFPRLSPAIRDWLSLHADMGDFGFGLGIGIGKIRRQIGEGVEKEAAAAAGKKMGNEFSEGLAIGFAGNPANLSDDGLLSKFLSGVQTDADFAKSFGFGLGRIFSMLEGGKRGRILETMGGNEGFFAGLGEGMGHHLPSTGSRAVEELMRATRSASLERGLAGGIAASFRHLDLPEVLGVLEYAGSSPEYGRVLGKDLAETFASFDEDRQSLILDAVQKDSEFSRQFSAAIEKNMPYVSAQMRERVKSMKAKLPHLQGAIEQEGIEKRGKKTRFEHFPAVGMSARGRMNWNVGNEEIAFSGKVQKCCVCFIDMVGSTKISSDLTAAQLSRYYEIFLNTIARIAGNFGAKIIKNAGDALILYFDSTEMQGDPGKSTRNFKNVLDCCLTMGMVSGALNAKMLSEKLPPVQYRISADYGEVSVAKSSSSQSEDLFGPAMNICAKINSKARPNGLVIGQTLFEQVKELDEYTFVPSAEKLVGLKGEYEVYHVDEREKTSVINPFERRAIE